MSYRTRVALAALFVAFFLCQGIALAQTNNTSASNGRTITIDNATRPGQMVDLYRDEDIILGIDWGTDGGKLLDGGKYALLAAGGKVYYAYPDYKTGKARFSLKGHGTGTWRVMYVGLAEVNGKVIELHVDGNLTGVRFGFLTADGKEAADEDTYQDFGAMLRRQWDIVPLDGTQTFWLDYPDGWIGCAPTDWPNAGAIYGVFLIDDDQFVDSQVYRGSGDYTTAKKSTYFAFSWSNMKNTQTGEVRSFTTRWLSYQTLGATPAPPAPDFSNLTVSVNPNAITTANAQATATVSMALPSGFKGKLTLTYPDGTIQEITFNSAIKDVPFTVNTAKNGNVDGRLLVTDTKGIVAFDRTWTALFKINLPPVITLKSALLTAPTEVHFTTGETPHAMLTLVTDPLDINFDSAVVKLTFYDGTVITAAFPKGTREIEVVCPQSPGNVKAELTVTFGTESATWSTSSLFRLVQDTPVVNPPTNVRVSPGSTTFEWLDGAPQGQLQLQLFTEGGSGCTYTGTAIHSNGSILNFGFNSSGIAYITPYQVEGQVQITVYASCGGSVYTFRLGGVFTVVVRTTPKPVITGVMITGLPTSLSLPQGQAVPTITGYALSVPSGFSCSGTLRLTYTGGQTQDIPITCGQSFSFQPKALAGPVSATVYVSSDSKDYVFPLGTIMTISTPPPTLLGVALSGIPSQVSWTIGQTAPDVTGTATSNPTGLPCSGTLTLTYVGGQTQTVNLSCSANFTFKPLAIEGSVSGKLQVTSNGIGYTFSYPGLFSVKLNPVTNACSISVSITDVSGNPVAELPAGSTYQTRVFAPNCRFQGGTVDITYPKYGTDHIDYSEELRRDYAVPQDPNYPAWTWISTQQQPAWKNGLITFSFVFQVMNYPSSAVRTESATVSILLK